MKFDHQKNRFYRGLSLAGVLIASLLIVVYALSGLSRPDSSTKSDREPSKMYVTSSRLAMDDSVLADLENANASESEKTETDEYNSEEPEENEEASEEQQEEQDHTGLENLIQQYEQGEDTAADQQIPGYENSEISKGDQTGDTGNNDTDDGSIPEDDGAGEGDTGGSGSGSGGGSGEGSGDGGGSGSGGNSGDGGSGSGDGISYFVTDIKDGATVKLPDYSFNISLTEAAASEGYSLVSNLVYINGSRVSFDNGGSVKLQEGENTLRVSVRVRGRNFTQLDAPYQTYHIYYIPDGHFFLGVYRVSDGSRLLDGDSLEVTESGFPIYVMASDSTGKVINASVMLNRSLQNGADGIYDLTLTPGANTLQVSAGNGAAKQSVSVQIGYRTDAFTLSIESAAVTESVSGDQFGDNTYVEYPSASQDLDVRLTCSAGSDHITSIVVQGTETATEMVNARNANGTIHITLSSAGETAIRVSCKDDGGAVRKYTWRIRFVRNGGYGDEKRPSLQTNLVNEELHTADFVLTASAVSNGSTQKQLAQPSYYKVTLNGNEVTCSGQSGAALEYSLHFQEGANIVSVTVTDDEQYSATKEAVVTYTPQAEQVHVTIVVDANVLGLGQWIGETISVSSDVTIAQLIEQELAAYGFSTVHSGTATTGDYYLAHIVRTGITNGWYISDTQRQYYETTGSAIDENVPADSLGEFDFTMNSGWMITLNNYFIGGSMGTRTVREGDVIHVQFTMNRGSDIGVDPDSDIYG